MTRRYPAPDPPAILFVRRGLYLAEARSAGPGHWHQVAWHQPTRTWRCDCAGFQARRRCAHVAEGARASEARRVQYYRRLAAEQAAANPAPIRVPAQPYGAAVAEIYG